MAKENLQASFDNLKNTVPLLLKHKVSAEPTNYALWYTYVSNASPDLNEKLDEAVQGNQGISPLKSEDLYRQYVSEKQEVSGWQLRQTVEGMLIELTQTTKDTKSDTNNFKQVVENCLDDLNKVEKEGLSVEEVMGLVRNMVKETQAIRQSTISFNSALTKAEEEIKQLRAKLEESEKAALYDALTGLCNRRYFDSELESKMGMETLSLMLIDIDHFKKINDTHGHQMGDLVLKAVAKKLQASCRDSAQVFRYGGEEFAVIAPSKDLKSARHLGDVMRRAIEKIAVKDRRTGENLGDITVSVGVAQREEKESVEQLIERADALLYDAKRLGRNRVMPLPG